MSPSWLYLGSRDTGLLDPLSFVVSHFSSLENHRSVVVSSEGLPFISLSGPLLVLRSFHSTSPGIRDELSMIATTVAETSILCLTAVQPNTAYSSLRLVFISIRQGRYFVVSMVPNLPHCVG